ncbi:MAG: site-specific DNA-methyltransferase [Ruminococcus sp.]|nr:site-specific DNA-methyltransferase [Ruminococcus sp.]
MMTDVMNVSISLKNENCFDFLKEVRSDSVSLILIDPPYEVSRDTNFQSGEATGKDTDRFRVSMDFGQWDYSFSGLAEVVSECYRILKKGGTMICFYDLWKITSLKMYFDRANFKQIRYIEWVKTNPVPLNSKINYLTNSREIALVGVKSGKPTFHSEYDNGIYQYPICHDKGRFHPTQKPVALFEDLILKHSNEGDLVLDCFSGSGTTAVAAFNTNRNFIGCELSKEYFDKSISRLRDCGIDISKGGTTNGQRQQDYSEYDYKRKVD